MTKEFTQLRDKEVFKPIHWSDLTRQEKVKVLQAVVFLKMKRCGRLKARAFVDGHKQRSLYAREDYSSPTVCTKSVLLSAVIEAFEGRNVKILDIPGAFLNCIIDDGDVVHICLGGVTVGTMVKIAPDVYGPYLHKDPDGKPVLSSKLIKALHGCVKSSILFWHLLIRVLKHEQFKPNLYDPCTMNKVIGGNLCTTLSY